LCGWGDLVAGIVGNHDRIHSLCGGRGHDLGTVVANRLRSDLPFRDKNHGFSIDIPDAVMDGRSHAIYVYAIDSRTGAETLLGGSPKSIRCGGSG